MIGALRVKMNKKSAYDFNPYKPCILIMRHTSKANNADPDQGIHYLLTECSIKIWIKIKNATQQSLKW